MEVQGLIGCPGIDINYATSHDGSTGLYQASYFGHLEVVKLLLSTPGIQPNKAQPDWGLFPLYIASQFGHDEVVKALLSHPKINPNQAKLGRLDREGTTPFIVAAERRHANVVKVLLKDGRVDPNKRRTGGWKNNAISEAAKRGNLEVVKLLLRCPKVALGVEDKFGKTELDYARENGHWDVVEAIESRSSYLQRPNRSTCPN